MPPGSRSPTDDSVPTGVDRIGGAGPAGVHGAGAAAVAVIDTGIDLSHPDLDARPGINCISATPGPPQDDDGHGTFVAGVIGARNNGAGVVGVAPGTALYAVKALSANGSGYIDDIICGIDWVTANAGGLGIRVVNMSLSGSERYEPLRLAIQRSVSTGIVFTVAAGNSAADVASEIPGSYPEVLTVTAMSDTDGAPGGGRAVMRPGPGGDRRRVRDVLQLRHEPRRRRPCGRCPGRLRHIDEAGRGREDGKWHQRGRSPCRGHRCAVHGRGRHPGTVRRDDVGGGDRSGARGRGRERNAAERLPWRSVPPRPARPLFRASRLCRRPVDPPDTSAAGLRS